MALTRSQSCNGTDKDRTQTTPDRTKKRYRELDTEDENETDPRPYKTLRQTRADSSRTMELDRSVLQLIVEQRRQLIEKRKQQTRGHFRMRDFLARKKSLASNRSRTSQSRKRSEPGDSDIGNATVTYADPKFTKLLEECGSYFTGSPSGLSQTSTELCEALLGRQTPLPLNDFFGDLFGEICMCANNRNKARVVSDITPNMVPSAEKYAMKHKGAHLVENWNESWSNAWLLSGIDKRPQPDYAVGFKRDAFTDEQHKKLKPWVGDAFANDQSPFMATYMMYFPFLTCEVKSDSAALAVADRQNGLSMTIAVKGVVQLFRQVERQEELRGEILGFSVSHDTSSVRIYAHYAEIAGEDTKFFREAVRTFYFTEQKGKERGTSYCFIMNVYETWVPMHLARIRAAVDELPEVESTCLSGLPPAAMPITAQESSKRPKVQGSQV
ncbi:hypothetical protein MY11210_003037 [Beauveria gryllotalpidicola]